MKADEKASKPTAVYIERVNLGEGKEVVKEWHLGEEIGRGSVAQCFYMTDTKNSKKYVCKRVIKSKITKGEDKQKLMQEIKLHKQLKHKNVVAFQHFFEYEDNICIMLEICHRKNMQ